MALSNGFNITGLTIVAGGSGFGKSGMMLYHCVGISDSDNKNLYCSLIVPPKIKKPGCARL